MDNNKKLFLFGVGAFVAVVLIIMLLYFVGSNENMTDPVSVKKVPNIQRDLMYKHWKKLNKPVI